MSAIELALRKGAVSNSYSSGSMTPDGGSIDYRYGDNMGSELVNQRAAKILLTVEDGDSINRISKKAGSSYSCTYKWSEKLEEVGVLERNDGVRTRDQNFCDTFQDVAQTTLRKRLDFDEAYLLSNFSGLEYRFSKTDAVYTWTKSGYQIGRNQRDYPVFIDILEKDVEEWRKFFKGFGVETSVEDRI